MLGWRKEFNWSTTREGPRGGRELDKLPGNDFYWSCRGSKTSGPPITPTCTYVVVLIRDGFARVVVRPLEIGLKMTRRKENERLGILNGPVH